MRHPQVPLLRAAAAILVALILGPLPCRAQSPPDSVYWICLERGDSLEAREVERVSKDFLRYRQANGAIHYVRATSVTHVFDASGSDRYHDFDPEPARPSAPVYQSFLFRGGDKSRCGSFLLTELSVLVPVTDDAGRGTEQSAFYCGDLGWMTNVGRRSALGASAFWEAGPSIERGGVRVRYRRWLGSRTSFEFSPGLVVAGDDPFQSPGFVGQAAINAGDLVSVVVEGEVDRYSWTSRPWNRPPATRELTDTSLRVGFRGGSFLALGTGAILVLVVAAAVAAVPDHW